MVVHSPLNFENAELAVPARELARRMSGTDEIVLLWHPDDDRVEVSVRDVTTDATFRIEIASGNALDAFTHPYAYAYAVGREPIDRASAEEVERVHG